MANIYNEPGSSNVIFTLKNNTHEYLLANIGIAKIGLVTDLKKFVYSDLMSNMYKVLTDSSGSENTPSTRLFFADSNGSASSHSDLTFDGLKLKTPRLTITASQGSIMFGQGDTRTTAEITTSDVSTYAEGDFVIKVKGSSDDNPPTEKLRIKSDGRLHVQGTPTFIGDTTRLLSITDLSAVAQGVGAGIDFQGKYNTSGDNTTFCGIKGVKANSTAGNYSGELHFQTRKHGSSPVTHWVIDEDGNIKGDGSVGLGTGATVLQQLSQYKGSASDNFHRIANSNHGNSSANAGLNIGVLANGDAVIRFGYGYEFGIEREVTPGLWQRVIESQGPNNIVINPLDAVYLSTQTFLTANPTKYYQMAILPNGTEFNAPIFMSHLTASGVLELDNNKYVTSVAKGTAYNKNFGTTSGTVCQGNDSRLSDARTPTSHASTHLASGSDQVFNQNLNTTDGPTFTGGYYKTNTGSNPLIITRTGDTKESMQMWVDDSRGHIYRKNDEYSSGLRITIENTDLENSDGSRANTNYWDFTSSNTSSSLTLTRGANTYTYWHSGNFDPSTKADSNHNHGTGIANYLTKFTNTSGAIGNSVISDDGTTATINGAMSVSGNINVGGLTASRIVETDATKTLVSVAKNTAYNKNFAGTGSATTVSRSDHTHSTYADTIYGSHDLTVTALTDVSSECSYTISSGTVNGKQTGLCTIDFEILGTYSTGTITFNLPCDAMVYFNRLLYISGILAGKDNDMFYKKAYITVSRTDPDLATIVLDSNYSNGDAVKLRGCITYPVGPSV